VSDLLKYSTIMRNDAVKEQLGMSTYSLDFRMTLLQVYTKSNVSSFQVDRKDSGQLLMFSESVSSEKSFHTRPISLAITGSTNFRDLRTTPQDK